MDYGFLLYSVSYNPLVSYLFGAILSKVWHLELLKADSCVFFDMTPLLFEYFIASQHNRMFQHICIFLSQSWKQTFLLGAWVPLNG